jgi:hypothetical protein
MCPIRRPVRWQARAASIGLLFDKTSPNYAKQVIDGAYRACLEQQYHLRFDQIYTDVDGRSCTPSWTRFSAMRVATALS